MIEKPPLDPRLTEQRNPATADIDRLSALEIVGVINDEDHRVVPAVATQLEQIARAVDMAEESFRAGGRLVYFGAGTSGRLGVLDATEMPPTYGTEPRLVQGVIAGGPQALVSAVEGAEDSREDGGRAADALELGPADFAFGIAASGSTPWVHGALTRAKQRGAKTGFLLCTPPEEWMIAVYDVVIAPLVGPEVVTGSTRMKAGTATKLVLNTITTGAMIRIGKTYGNLMVDLKAWNDKLVDRSQRIVMEAAGVDRLAAQNAIRGAEGRVKTAIVMARLGVPREEAERLLAKNAERLRAVVGDPPPVVSK